MILPGGDAGSKNGRLVEIPRRAGCDLRIPVWIKRHFAGHGHQKSQGCRWSTQPTDYLAAVAEADQHFGGRLQPGTWISIAWGAHRALHLLGDHREPAPRHALGLVAGTCHRLSDDNPGHFDDLWTASPFLWKRLS